MIERISNSWVNRMTESGIIEKDKAQLYEFGMQHGLRTLFEIIVMLVASIVLGMFIQGAMMILCFCCIRIYAGGYHARTSTRCIGMSFGMFLFFLLWQYFLPANLILQICVVFLVGICLVFACPLPDPNKPLLEYEIPKYRKIALYIYGVEVIVYIIGTILEQEKITRGLTCGMGMLLVVWGLYAVRATIHLLDKHKNMEE